MKSDNCNIKRWIDTFCLVSVLYKFRNGMWVVDTTVGLYQVGCLIDILLFIFLSLSVFPKVNRGKGVNARLD